MEPALVTASLVGLFAATHIGLASHPIRPRLARRLGELGFLALFSAVASLCFALLVHYTATHVGQGAPGLALGQTAGLRWLLIGAVVVGFALMAGSLAVYSSSPMALFSDTVGEPRGIDRISRHAFFMGVVCWSGAHALLATHLVATVFFAGLAGVAWVGSAHQDRKLTRHFGNPYREYLARTSRVPFAAILAGRQQLVLGEIPWLALALGVGVAFVLRQVHEYIFAAGGAWFISATLLGAALATLASLGQLRRRAANLEEKQWTT